MSAPRPEAAAPAIDFYFDFASPYGYLASVEIDAIAGRHGYAVTWRPFMLGAVFKLEGPRPLVDYPLKGAYTRRDVVRCARRLGIPFQLPEGFPRALLAPARAFYWLSDRDPALAKHYARAAYAAYFGAGRDISRPEAAAPLGPAVGVAAATLLAAIQEPAIKERLKQETDAAIGRGGFGSPFLFVGGEPFWGADRLGEVDRWLASGGW
ncbi:MAG: 2-hydroxychromene-2-carboxylate isomerase [Alphaproteobacteria bacterium]|nr:2-hydroxychromene-2-carboxylate isomerase [Alphaproteobacteria bacterium]